MARLDTAQCALDCSLLEWRFGRRARARRYARRLAPAATGDAAGRDIAKKGSSPIVSWFSPLFCGLYPLPLVVPTLPIVRR